jgi:prepilin peptidase CpaA
MRGQTVNTEILWYGAMGLAAGAGWSDWRTRRIPNWLTVSGLIAGLLANLAIHQWAGAKAALAGSGVALGLLFPLVLLRGLGAGDWKLMGALGAFLGPARILSVLWGAMLLAGIVACVMVTRAHRWAITLKNLWELLVCLFVFRLRPHPHINLGNPQSLSLPFGTVVAVATPICYAATVLLVRI